MHSRISNELVVVRALPKVLKSRNWTKAMRKSSGLNYLLLTPKKPDYILPVNSFFGHFKIEDLPPLVAAVGSILAAEYPPLYFLHHKLPDRIALEMRSILPHAVAWKIIQGLVHVMEEGVVDGLIWSVGESGWKLFDAPEPFTIQ